MGKIKIDYKELLSEINEEVAEGVLLPEDTIQILRDSEPVVENYYAIIDWYYDDYAMKEELNTPLEDMYLPEEFTKDEWEEMKADQAALKAQYEEDKPKLQEMKVKDVLTEMKQIQKLF